MLHVGSRLRAARLKTGLSQEAFGQIGNVSRAAQFSYESGKSSPDADYLAAIGAAGVDIVQILTGEVRSDSLQQWQTEILDAVSVLDREWRGIILEMALKAASGTRPIVQDGMSNLNPDGRGRSNG